MEVRMTVLPQNPQSRLEPELIPRRDALGLAALWTMATAWLFAAFGMLRLPKAAVVASPSKKFRLLLPDAIAPGEAFVPPGRTVAVFRDSQGVHAVSLVCTHLGCIVKPTTEGFDCPCHGSRYSADGSVVKGPAPQPLPWLKVTASAGQLVVDEGANVPVGTKVNV
jgi:cytochrome b6-f complex iron-sulfur subunit